MATAQQGSPWRRRATIGLLWVATALLFVAWLLGTRPSANNQEVLVESTIRGLDLLDLPQKKAALTAAFRDYRQTRDLGSFLLALAFATAVGAAVAAPVWSSVAERRLAAAKAAEAAPGGAGGPGGPGGAA